MKCNFFKNLVLAENGETETIEANKKHEFEILDEIVNAHESFAANFTPAAN
jgi:hypothetical protein